MTGRIFTPYLNKCVQLDIPSRAVSVAAFFECTNQFGGGELRIHLFLDVPC